MNYVEKTNIEALKADIIFNENWDIEFLHKIVSWIEVNSYWIEIAWLYNIPKEIIINAKNIREKKKML